MSAAEHEAWAAGIERVHTQAGGVLGLYVIRKEDAPPMVAAALDGDKEAAALLGTTTETIQRIESAPPRRPMLCCACPRSLRNGRYSVIIARSAIGGEGDALTCAVCHRCASTHAAAMSRAMVAMRVLWPDLRPVTVSEGGRA